MGRRALGAVEWADAEGDGGGGGGGSRSGDSRRAGGTGEGVRGNPSCWRTAGMAVEAGAVSPPRDAGEVVEVGGGGGRDGEAKNESALSAVALGPEVSGDAARRVGLLARSAANVEDSGGDVVPERRLARRGERPSGGL